jgi:CDP-paratose 2-epimerase
MPDRHNQMHNERARTGDHRWWLSDLQAFKADCPGWRLTYGTEEVLCDSYAHNAERWAAIAR